MRTCSTPATIRAAGYLVMVGVLVAVSLALAAPRTASAQRGLTDLHETAVNLGLKKLTDACTATGVIEVMTGPGPLTLFAPTDAAFDKVPPAVLEALAADPALLKSVLLYHVVPSGLDAADVATLQTARTANGANIMVQSGPTLRLNDATVIRTDLRASNGVIHTIDTVLIPPDVAAAVGSGRLPRAGDGDVPAFLPALTLGLLLLGGGLWLWCESHLLLSVACLPWRMAPPSSRGEPTVTERSAPGTLRRVVRTEQPRWECRPERAGIRGPALRCVPSRDRT